MFSKQRLALLSAAGVVLAASGVMLAPTPGVAAEMTTAPQLSYDSAVIVTDVAPAILPSPAQPSAPVAAAMAAVEDEDEVDPQELECMAKVVMHESRGQPRSGQVAVAQTLMNRLKAGRFGGSICQVATQRGQFFGIASFHPRRESNDWAVAVDVSRAVLGGDAATVAPGAMYFRAAYSKANSFFQSRQRVAAIGGQIFYR